MGAGRGCVVRGAWCVVRGAWCVVRKCASNGRAILALAIAHLRVFSCWLSVRICLSASFGCRRVGNRPVGDILFSYSVVGGLSANSPS